MIDDKKYEAKFQKLMKDVVNTDTLEANYD